MEEYPPVPFHAFAPDQPGHTCALSAAFITTQVDFAGFGNPAFQAADEQLVFGIAFRFVFQDLQMGEIVRIIVRSFQLFRDNPPDICF